VAPAALPPEQRGSAPPLAFSRAEASRVNVLTAAAQAERTQALFGDGRHAQAVARTSLSSLSATTAANYRQRWTRYVDFCAEEGHDPQDARSPLLWLASLMQAGRIAGHNASQYMVPINYYFSALWGMARPSLGPYAGDYSRFKRGWRQGDADTGRVRFNRVPLPASVARAALEAAEALVVDSQASLLDFRALYHVAFGFAEAARADTGASLALDDVTVDAAGVIRVQHATAKGARTAAERAVRLIDGATCGGRLARLTLRWLELQRALRRECPDGEWRFLPDVGDKENRGKESFWRTPVDTVWRSSSALCSSWVARACQLLGVAPPPGDTWTSHSLRSGAASAAAALGVQLYQIQLLGGWKSPLSLQQHYVFGVTPCAAGMFFFGHLLPASIAQRFARTT